MQIIIHDIFGKPTMLLFPKWLRFYSFTGSFIHSFNNKLLHHVLAWISLKAEPETRGVFGKRSRGGVRGQETEKGQRGRQQHKDALKSWLALWAAVPQPPGPLEISEVDLVTVHMDPEWPHRH